MFFHFFQNHRLSFLLNYKKTSSFTYNENKQFQRRLYSEKYQDIRTSDTVTCHKPRDRQGPYSFYFFNYHRVY